MDRIKEVRSPDYNYIFNRENGMFVRWGDTLEDDPDFSPLGPEIADIEISTMCSQGCQFCYKANTACGKNMSFSQFVSIFHKLPKNLTQIAFGIGDIDGNPDLYKILAYTRDNDVTPNITINGSHMHYTDYEQLASLCGAVAVSNYDKETCLSTVCQLYNWTNTMQHEHETFGCQQPTLKQINIHQLLSEETYSECMDLMENGMANNTLCRIVNAIVFLSLKPKGRAAGQYHQLKDMNKFKALVDFALKYKIPIGFDSCTCNSFLRAIQGRKDEKELAQCADPCESTCFSIYIDVDGFAMPCSFSSGLDVPSINMNNVDDFLKDVWFNPKMVGWRDALIKNGRSCPLYDLEIR